MNIKTKFMKRALLLALVFALAASVLASCGATVDAEADNVFKTEEAVEAKGAILAALYGYWNDNKDADSGSVSFAEEKTEVVISFLPDSRTKMHVDIVSKDGISIETATEKDGKVTVICKKVSFETSVSDSTSLDNIAYIPEDMINNVTEATAEVSVNGKDYSIPVSLGSAKLSAKTVSAEKVNFTDNTASDLEENVSDKVKESVLALIVEMTPVLDAGFADATGLRVYDPYADAITYTNARADDGFSITQIFRIPLGWILQFAFKLVKNYALALLLFAIVIKVVLFPFGIIQQKGTVKQAKFRPKEAAIRKKYEGRTDQATVQKMNQEIMDEQQKENINMFSGCLPLLIQLPVLFALFNVIRNPLRYMCELPASVVQKLQIRLCQLFSNGGIEVSSSLLNSRYGGLSSVAKALGDISASSRGELAAQMATKASSLDSLNMLTVVRNNFAHFADLLEGTKVASIDNIPDFHLFSNFCDLSVKPDFWNWMLIIPVLTYIVVFFSTLLTKKMTYQPMTQQNAGLSGKLMDYGMPLVQAYFAFIWPAIMGLYWIYQSILGVLQQFILKKMFPLPVFTEEDYKRAELEVMGKTLKKPRAVPSQYAASDSRPRSLHHIDDDDDTVPTNKPQSKLPKKSSGTDSRDDTAQITAGAPAGKKNSVIGFAALKGDKPGDDKSEAKSDEEQNAPADADEGESAGQSDVTVVPRRRGKKKNRRAQTVLPAGADETDGGDDSDGDDSDSGSDTDESKE